MKKLIIVTFIITMLVNISCALADPEDMQGQFLPDFIVNTIDGESFMLSDSLKTHDLVLINFWATWCGPCCMEFPYLENAWENYADRVDVIALSVEETDSVDTLKKFAQDYGLNFQIGRDDVKLFDSMAGSAIPTTLIVDKYQRVVAVEIGSKTTVQEFTDLFDQLLAPSMVENRQGSDRCILYFQDIYGNPIPGVTVGFCNGECTLMDSDNNGRIAADYDPNEYHIHLLQLPEGYAQPWNELQISGQRFSLTITLFSE